LATSLLLYIPARETRGLRNEHNKGNPAIYAAEGGGPLKLGAAPPRFARCTFRVMHKNILDQQQHPRPLSG
jgi:hypothetical protein